MAWFCCMHGNKTTVEANNLLKKRQRGGSIVPAAPQAVDF